MEGNLCIEKGPAAGAGIHMMTILLKIYYNIDFNKIQCYI